MFALFYCLLDLRSGECNVVSLTGCELFGEKNRNMFGCVCYFVVEGDGVIVCGWRCSIG